MRSFRYLPLVPLMSALLSGCIVSAPRWEVREDADPSTDEQTSPQASRPPSVVTNDGAGSRVEQLVSIGENDPYRDVVLPAWLQTVPFNDVNPADLYPRIAKGELCEPPPKPKVTYRLFIVLNSEGWPCPVLRKVVEDEPCVSVCPAWKSYWSDRYSWDDRFWWERGARKRRARRGRVAKAATPARSPKRVEKAVPKQSE
jgi:hypothetical protein